MVWQNRVKVGVMVLAAGVAAAATTAGSALAAQAPAVQPAEKALTGTQVLERYLEKTGGREAYLKITSRTSKGKLEVKAAGISAAVTIAQNAEGKIRVTTNITGVGNQEQGFDGTIAWETNPMTGARIVTGDEREQFLAETPLNSELKFADRYASIENVGEETIGDKPAYKVVLKGKSGSEETRWYDKESGLLLKSSQVSKTAQGDIKVESYPSDWRAVDGVLMPFSTRQVAAGAEYVIALDSVVQNAPIPAETFTPPEEVQKLAAKAK
jgi:hypothetical protein